MLQFKLICGRELKELEMELNDFCKEKGLTKDKTTLEIQPLDSGLLIIVGYEENVD